MKIKVDLNLQICIYSASTSKILGQIPKIKNFINPQADFIQNYMKQIIYIL